MKFILSAKKIKFSQHYQNVFLGGGFLLVLCLKYLPLLTAT